jgi:hypothetical protein
MAMHDSHDADDDDARGHQGGDMPERIVQAIPLNTDVNGLL